MAAVWEQRLAYLTYPARGRLHSDRLAGPLTPFRRRDKPGSRCPVIQFECIIAQDMTYCNGETSVIRPNLTSPGAYLILLLGESLISQPSGEVHTPVWSQTFMSPVGHSDPLYEGSPMEADSFWRCTGSVGVRPSVESGKDTKAKELMESGRTNRKSGHGNPGLSSATVRSLHLMLHNALNRAVKERLILRNPTEDCIAPKVQKFEMQILQPEHIKTYLDAAEKRGLLPMFYLELVSGLRKGELTALLWSDLDITNRTISVSKQYVKNPNGELTLSRPKTETSVRKVSISQEAVDLLVAEHKRHPNNPYMFPSPITREMYHPDPIVNLHKKILKDAGLPHIRFHDLRHTFATLALQNGVDVKTVSSMLGHYDAGFTLRTYTHATRQKQDEAAQTMGSFMAQVM